MKNKLIQQKSLVYTQNPIYHANELTFYSLNRKKADLSNSKDKNNYPSFWFLGVGLFLSPMRDNYSFSAFYSQKVSSFVGKTQNRVYTNFLKGISLNLNIMGLKNDI